MNVKKIFIGSGILLVTITIFLIVYNFAFRDAPDESAQIAEQEAAQDQKENTNNVSAQKKNDVPKNEQIIPVSKETVIAPAVHKDANAVLYYQVNDGVLVSASVNGGQEKVEDARELPGLIFAVWSPDRKKTITKFMDKTGVRFYNYDHEAKSGTKLKDGMERVEWTIAGDQILYTFFDAKTNRTSLNIANPDGTEWRVLQENVPRGTRFTAIPESTRVAFWRAPNPQEKGDLQILNVVDNKPGIKTIFNGQYNTNFLFSPDGERILVSSSQNKGSNTRTLGIMNGNGGEYKNLQIPTNVDKCAWAANSKIIYCAFPTGDRDTFWKIDVTTNKKERIVNLDDVVGSSVRYQAQNLTLSPDGETIFFINTLDGRLYRIAL